MAMNDPAAVLGVIHIGIDPVLFHLGRLAVHWYGIMYAIAFAVGFRYGVLPHLRERGVAQPTIERLTAWTILWGLLGGRLYYVVQQPDLKDFLLHPIRIIAVWEGGMAFFGAIIGALTAIWVLAGRSRLSFWLLADAGVLFAVIGQPIGRLGNIINGDILGSASTLPWATAYTFHVNPGQCSVLQPGFYCDKGYQPAAAYEAIGTLVILGILFLLRRRGVRDGVLAITYVAAYSVSQLLIFPLRASEPVVLRGLNLKQAQVTALVVLVIGVPALYWLWKRSPESSAPKPPPRPRKVRAPRPPRPPKPVKAARPKQTPPPPPPRADRSRTPARGPAAPSRGGPPKSPAPPPKPGRVPAGRHDTREKGARPSGSPPPPAAAPPRGGRPAPLPPPPARGSGTPPSPRAVKPPPPAPLPPPPPKK